MGKPRSQMVIEPAKDGEGWYWALLVEGGVFADGNELGHATARDKAHEAWKQYQAMQ